MDHANPSKIPSWNAAQVILATTFVVGVGAVFWLLFRFSAVVLLLIIAILLGTAINPIVDWLNHRGLPRAAGVVLVYLLIVALIAGIWSLTMPLIFEQSTELSQKVPTYYQEIRDALLHSSSRFIQEIGLQIPPQISLLIQSKPATGGASLDRVAQTILYAGLVARTLLAVLAIFLLAFYWTLESERTIRTLLFFYPATRREGIRALIADFENRVGGYIRGQILLCLSIGFFALIAYLIIGLPYALVLAVIAAILEAVPMIGPVLGAVPAVLMAFSFAPNRVIWVLVAVAAMQAFENYVLVPRIMRRSVGVNSIVVLLAIAAFTALLGLPGAFLAVPTAAVVQLLIDRLVIQPVTNNIPETDGRDRLSVLRYETQELVRDVRKQLRQKEDQSAAETDRFEDSIETLANDLDNILAGFAAEKQDSQVQD